MKYCFHLSHLVCGAVVEVKAMEEFWYNSKKQGETSEHMKVTLMALNVLIDTVFI